MSFQFNFAENNSSRQLRFIHTNSNKCEQNRGAKFKRLIFSQPEFLRFVFIFQQQKSQKKNKNKQADKKNKHPYT